MTIQATAEPSIGELLDILKYLRECEKTNPGPIKVELVKKDTRTQIYEVENEGDYYPYYRPSQIRYKQGGVQFDEKLFLRFEDGWEGYFIKKGDEIKMKPDHRESITFNSNSPHKRLEIMNPTIRQAVLDALQPEAKGFLERILEFYNII